MSDKIRCFIAIELSREIRQFLEQIENKLKQSIIGIKWVRPENIHLTLKFLGHIDKKVIGGVKKIISQIAHEYKSFTIRLSVPGAFPNPEYPRVIWIGIDIGVEECTSLAQHLEEKLVSLGIEKESRPFHPHLTLARIKLLKDKSLVKDAFTALKIPQIEMAVSKITLFQSILSSEGATYTILYEAKLGDKG
jgi:2'-5' RNA ligase